MLTNMLPVLKVRAEIEADPSLPPHFQVVLDQLYYRLGQVYQANEHLDTKALGLLQAAGLILALIGALKFPVALYGNELWAKSGIAVGFFAFAGMVLLTLLAWKPADFPVPGPADWDKIYDDYVTVPIGQTFDQLLQDGLEVQRRLLALNRHKASRLAGSTVLFAVQLAGLLLLALAS